MLQRPTSALALMSAPGAQRSSPRAADRCRPKLTPDGHPRYPALAASMAAATSCGLMVAVVLPLIRKVGVPMRPRVAPVV